MSFSRAHFSMLIKYIGISFITWAISHGAFSGTRSLITATFGIFCFVLGTFLEDDTQHTWRTIFTSALLAIGIWAVTGWLQHFPDSPERSLLIIPIGFIISIFLYAHIHEYKLTQKIYHYITVSSLIALVSTVGIYFLIEKTNIAGHSHGEEKVVNIGTPNTHENMTMKDMEDMLVGKTGDELDRAFLEAMIPHHEWAINMAKYLENAKHPELQTLGSEIISAQSKEIAQMKQWMIDWWYDKESNSHDH